MKHLKEELRLVKLGSRLHPESPTVIKELGSTTGCPYWNTTNEKEKEQFFRRRVYWEGSRPARMSKEMNVFGLWISISWFAILCNILTS